MEEIQYDLAEVHDLVTIRLHKMFCPRPDHSDANRNECEEPYRFGAGFLVAALMPALLREVSPKIRASERERVADKIEGELVCCDIFEQMEQALSPEAYRSGAWDELRYGPEYHDICRFGGWAAAIARGK